MPAGLYRERKGGARKRRRTKREGEKTKEGGKRKQKAGRPQRPLETRKEATRNSNNFPKVLNQETVEDPMSGKGKGKLSQARHRRVAKTKDWWIFTQGGPPKRSEKNEKVYYCLCLRKWLGTYLGRADIEQKNKRDKRRRPVFAIRTKEEL